MDLPLEKVNENKHPQYVCRMGKAKLRAKAGAAVSTEDLPGFLPRLTALPPVSKDREDASRATLEPGSVKLHRFNKAYQPKPSGTVSPKRESPSELAMLCA